MHLKQYDKIDDSGIFTYNDININYLKSVC
jgi:hypothetical protein